MTKPAEPVDKLPAKFILIQVRSGLVQDVQMSVELLGTDVYLIDYDNINEGDLESPPWSGWKPDILTPKEMQTVLDQAETEHKHMRTCDCCGEYPTFHTSVNCPKRIWENDAIQFPKLLLALKLLGIPKRLKARLAKALGVQEGDLDTLMTRADTALTAAEAAARKD